MDGTRATISWLLLVMLAVVGGGAAVLGASQAPPKNVSLDKAVTNTLNASSYTEDVSESTPQGSQTLHFVYQAPDRLGGYVQSGRLRSYVYIIGTSGYRAITVPAGTPTNRLHFYRQSIPPGTAQADGVAVYLQPASRGANKKTSNGVTTMTISQGGVTATFVYTVSGQYVSALDATAPGQAVHLIVTDVGSSPSVSLPAGAKVAGIPTTGSSAG